MLLSWPLVVMSATSAVLLLSAPCRARATGNVDSQRHLSRRMWPSGQGNWGHVPEEAREAANQLRDGLFAARAEAVQPVRPSAEEHPSSSYSTGEGPSRSYGDVPGYHSPYRRDLPLWHRVGRNTPAHVIDEWNRRLNRGDPQPTTFEEAGAQVCSALQGGLATDLLVRRLRWATKFSEGDPDAAESILQMFKPVRAVLRAEDDLAKMAASPLEVEQPDLVGFNEHHTAYVQGQTVGWRMETKNEALKVLTAFHGKLLHVEILSRLNAPERAFSSEVASALSRFVEKHQ